MIRSAPPGNTELTTKAIFILLCATIQVSRGTYDPVGVQSVLRKKEVLATDARGELIGDR